MAEPILEAIHISKSFNRVRVLHDVDFTLHKGEVHGVVGQNGAGKSTLMKILNGVYTKDAGTIRIGGLDATYNTPLGARQSGISMVFQEFSLIPTLTVAQNVFLTREPHAQGVLLNDKACERRTAEILRDLGVDIDPTTTVQALPVGSQQVVEIAKALSQKAKILILDEPTASLSHNEIEILFAVIRRLKATGISIIYISHHLREVLEICDRITVIRDGRGVFTREVRATDLGEVIRAMLGASMQGAASREGHRLERVGPPLLEVRNLSSGRRITGVSFSLWPNEVLGIAGLLGSGRSELVRAILSVDRRDTGEVLVRGHKAGVRSVKDAIRLGMALVPEDRRRQGLVLEHSVRDNMLLPVWDKLTRLLFINDRAANKLAGKYTSELQIKTAGVGQVVKFLSGGNQQKVVIGRSLASKPSILFLDDPTIGIDIESKREILDTVRRFADAGNGVVFISSELEQLAALCDRVLILRKGQVAGEVIAGQAPVITEEFLLSAIQ